MPELAFESFPQLFEAGQLPNVNSLKANSEEDQDILFAAILRAIVLLGNNPCSSQEIANCIVRYKLAVFGGSSPYVAVSNRIAQYFKCASELQSPALMLLARVEDQTSPANIRYYLPCCNDPQPFADVYDSFDDATKKRRPSPVVDQPMKKVKSDAFNEVDLLSPLPFDDSWVAGMSGFDFDTIIPVEYERSSSGSSFEDSTNDSDSIDERSDVDSKSDLESFDSESEVEQGDFCEDMMNGNMYFDLLTNTIGATDSDNVFSPLSDQEFHSDSSHTSTESGTSSASPLLTPEPSSRRGSEIMDTITSIHPSIFGDDYGHHWENSSFQNVQEVKCDSIDVMNFESLQLPELDELLGINEIHLDQVNSTAPITPVSIKSAELYSENVSIDQAQKDPVDPSNTTGWSPLKPQTNVIEAKSDVYANPIDEVSSFLYLDEDLEKEVPNPTHGVKPASYDGQGSMALKDSQKNPGPVLPCTKVKPRAPKQKSRSFTTAESNPNMLISPISSISPQIHITMVESLPFYITTVGPAEGFANTYQLLRRYDSGYVNASTLLAIGGVESEKEQAVVLSLEIRRIRIRRQESSLFGTWIPLQRARQLAATCSLQHKLGPFLDYDLPSYFPSQLPPHLAAFNPAQVSSRLQQFMKTRAASLKPRDSYVANIGIAPRCLHPTSKSFFSGVGHQLNQILGLQSKQLKSYSALEDSNNSRRPSKAKSSSQDLDESTSIDDINLEADYLFGESSEVDNEEFETDLTDFLDFENVDHFTQEDVDININGGGAQVNFL
ncbi:hypothetical protein K7432_012294 [Basidiobolus ranarum]|uniref:HTH APSES-type domain-containing protein n=1 Tax=Basidiobolus ranarum TaxID=34480 RepID=A0ABR2VSW7_9FUNG